MELHASSITPAEAPDRSAFPSPACGAIAFGLSASWPGSPRPSTRCGKERFLGHFSVGGDEGVDARDEPGHDDFDKCDRPARKRGRGIHAAARGR
jgi:hypothetical protein